MKSGAKLCVALIVLSLLIVGGTYGALLIYFGQIKVTTTVEQAVLVDGKDYTMMPIEETASVAGGESFCRPHYLTSQTSVPVTLQFETTFTPDGTGITVKYLKSLGYTAEVETVNVYDNYPANVMVEDMDCAIKWTFDMIGDKVLEGEGHWGYGLIIALDGVGEPPAFQIHNNDGTDASYPWGTHLYSYWGPSGTGFYGWHTSDRNTLVSELNWVNCTGDRYITDNPTGTFTVTISKCMLGTEFHWAVWVGAGGFYAPYGGQSAYPASFRWDNSDVVDTNYELATIAEEIVSPFTLGPGERLDFYICYAFDALIKPGTYTITTTIK